MTILSKSEIFLSFLAGGLLSQVVTFYSDYWTSTVLCLIHLVFFFVGMEVINMLLEYVKSKLMKSGGMDTNFMNGILEFSTKMGSMLGDFNKDLIKKPGNKKIKLRTTHELKSNDQLSVISKNSNKVKPEVPNKDKSDNTELIKGTIDDIIYFFKSININNKDETPKKCEIETNDKEVVDTPREIIDRFLSLCENRAKNVSGDRNKWFDTVKEEFMKYSAVIPWKKIPNCMVDPFFNAFKNTITHIDDSIDGTHTTESSTDNKDDTPKEGEIKTDDKPKVVSPPRELVELVDQFISFYEKRSKNMNGDKTEVVDAPLELIDRFISFYENRFKNMTGDRNKWLDMIKEEYMYFVPMLPGKKLPKHIVDSFFDSFKDTSTHVNDPIVDFFSNFVKDSNIVMKRIMDLNLVTNTVVEPDDIEDDTEDLKQEIIRESIEDLAEDL
jgi:hypothetical protein